MNSLRRPPREFLWALKDVSFEVQQGEVVGLIGRNGAGKTTLLKLLARITRPTSGLAEIQGRVGSLLEVGTGFHPELTGRENIYLSGAILGMSKKEIGLKFGAIVAFAEVERFIDTPLKHYSSGMQMRLAFAVAAHLEPEILLVDEVLAVGDLEFQKKCLGKMQEVSSSGRTIIFVSHQMNQIRRLCERALWIDAGGVRREGRTSEVIAAYEAASIETGCTGAEANGCFQRWEVAEQGHIVKNPLEPLAFQFVLRLQGPVAQGHFGLHLYNDASQLVASWGFDDLEIDAGIQELHVDLPCLPLRPGTFTMMCSLYNGGNNLTGGRLLEVWHAVPYLVVEATAYSHPQDAWVGIMNIPGTVSVRSHSTSLR